RPQEDELQDDPEHEHRGRDHYQPDEWVEPEIAVQRVAQVRAENDQRALSHVDDTHHAEAEGEPARHQGVDPTGKQPENAGLDEDVHLSSSFPYFPQAGLGENGFATATFGGYTGSSRPFTHSTSRSSPFGCP